MVQSMMTKEETAGIQKVFMILDTDGDGKL
jgi:Ca2+-binding EF-hand superfamily protein